MIIGVLAALGVLATLCGVVSRAQGLGLQALQLYPAGALNAEPDGPRIGRLTVTVHDELAPDVAAKMVAIADGADRLPAAEFDRGLFEDRTLASRDAPLTARRPFVFDQRATPKRARAKMPKSHIVHQARLACSVSTGCTWAETDRLFAAQVPVK